MSTILKALRRLEEDKPGRRSGDDSGQAAGYGESIPATDPRAADALRGRILAEEYAAEATGEDESDSFDKRRMLFGAIGGAVAFVLGLGLYALVGDSWFGASEERAPIREARSVAEASAPAADPVRATPATAPAETPSSVVPPSVASVGSAHAGELAEDIGPPAQDDAAEGEMELAAVTPTPAARSVARTGAGAATASASASATAAAPTQPSSDSTTRREAVPPRVVDRQVDRAEARQVASAKPANATKSEISASVPAERAPAPATAPAPEPVPESRSAARPPADPEPTRASVQAPRPGDARPASAPPPPPVAAAKRVEMPDLVVVRTAWHPKPDRRSAKIRLEETGDVVTLREGDAVGGMVIQEISPSAVLFKAGDVEVSRRIGQGGSRN